MAHDVFISYASEDKAIADALCATLEAKKIRCWIAPRDVQPGLPYGESIIEALDATKLMLLVFSSNSNRSPHVMREIERVVSKGIPIVPFRIEDVQPSRALEYFIANTHWLDALTPPVEKHLNYLADTVSYLLQRSCDQGEHEAAVAGNAVIDERPGFNPVPMDPEYKKPLRKRLAITAVAVVVILAGILLVMYKSPYSASITLGKTNQQLCDAADTLMDEDRDYPGAVEVLNKVVTRDPSFAAAYVKRGKAFMLMGKPDKALVDFNKYLGFTSNSLAYASRGWAYTETKAYDKAMPDFGKAVELDANFAPTYIYRGKAYQAMGNNEAALNDFSKAISLATKDPWGYYQRGLLYKGWTNHNDLALSDFKKVVALDYLNRWPDAANQINLLTAAAPAGSVNQAPVNTASAPPVQTAQRTAITTPPAGSPTRAPAPAKAPASQPAQTGAQSAKELSKQAMSLLNAGGDPQKVLELCNQALAINPDSDEVLDTRGLNYERMGQPAKAFADLNRAVEINPNNGYRWLHRGEYYLKYGNIELAAINDLKKAVEVGTRNGETYAVDLAKEHLKSLGVSGY